MSEKVILVTTGLKLYEPSDSVLFLGDWCLQFEDELPVKHVVKKHRWVDRKKFESDYNTLADKYKTILPILACMLNERLSTKHPIEFWEIIIGPWLHTFISVLIERVGNISDIKTDNVEYITFDIDKESSIKLGYTESVRHMCFSDIYNHNIYIDAIKYLQPENITIQKATKIKVADSRPHLISNRKSKTPEYVFKIARVFDRMLQFFETDEKRIVIYESGLDHFSNFLLSYLKASSHRFYFEFRRSRLEEREVTRKSPIFDNASKTSFNSFIVQMCWKYMPVNYLEDFSKIYETVMRIPKSKMVYTSNAHFHNDIFKTWLAHQKTYNDSKIVISSHGGALRSKYEVLNYEENISDAKVVWHTEYHLKHKQLPPNKSIRNAKYKGGSYIGIIGVEFPVYTYRIQSSTASSLTLLDVEQKILLIKLISDNHAAEIRYRPYPDSGWQVADRLTRACNIIIDGRRSLSKFILNASLVICTYPQTTFFEAMHSGTPTILIYKSTFWEVDEHFIGVVNQLIESNIIFDCPHRAADHIKSIHSNPLLWWESPSVQRARNSFSETCGRPENWIKRFFLYSKFFKELN